MNKKYIKYINYIVNDIEPPYFKNMEDIYGASENEYELVLSKIFNQPVTFKREKIYDTYDDDNHIEIGEGYSVNYKDNQKGGEIYYEFVDDGFWYKKEYDQNGNEIYLEDSSGDWVKREYDSNNNEIYYEDSTGSWTKREYDQYGNQTYYESSDDETNYY